MKPPYAFALTTNLAGVIDEALGSDAYLPLDGRLSTPNLRLQAEAHFKWLSASLHKGYIGYNLYQRNAGPTSYFF